ncbi:MAG: stage II sporulation protein R [Bacillota bacterium]
MLTEKGNKDFLRIHILANSNSDFDQSVKIKVKDVVTLRLSKILIDAKNKEDAKRIIQNKKEDIIYWANQELISNNINYKAQMDIKRQEFPARVYDGIVFEKGLYDAVIITLGQGQGDNWWCVAFPPLCFISAGGDEIRYKSKIMEIIKNAK